MSGRPTGRAAAGWLTRLLNLVPYLQARPGIPIAEAAADLGVTPQQLRDDLELLWVCGLPGYGPGDLIDMVFDGDRVSITYDAGMDRPLRLTPDEAVALLVALRMLAETPGVADRGPIDRALAKIEAVVGEAPPVAVAQLERTEALERVRDAVGQGNALEITYYSATSDRTTVRVVDPVRVMVVGRFGYLEAWCRRAGEVRRFRVDRIDELRVLDEPAAPPAAAGPLPARVFQPTAQSPLVTLRVGRSARWIAEYYPCETVDDSAEEWLISLRASDLDWARRLVLRLGPEVTVVAPGALAQAVRDEATAALEAYATPTGLATRVGHAG
ncbi:WYL domain-containing protein [Natronosporangium hydrolyticum]|uniref:WYL domain-containing protein n=1 Tax=Natronosporangium hydrolyticum TaxID=2811111 RepID=A0A895Y5K0_9ACTN|nr:WYL domain-containing protein [Natronosporangium hydrolyticum]QSB12681.1 WYL domain-containing protein [Natronosporangium hydrolyticum]